MAQKMAYCLRHMDLIELIGRRGCSNLYTYKEMAKDAQAYFQKKVEDLDGVCYQPEKDR
jgi:hypothetical protein